MNDPRIANPESAADVCDAADDARSVARGLAALAHPVRLTILRRLSCFPACCVKDVVPHVGLAQSTVSQHLKVLVGAGLVSYRPDRQASCYSIDRTAVDRLRQAVSCLLEGCCATAEKTADGVPDTSHPPGDGRSLPRQM